MQNLIDYVDGHVALIKTLGILFAFAVGFAVQIKYPYHKNERQIFYNMANNTAFAIVNLIVVALFVGSAVYNWSRYLEYKGWGLLNVFSIHWLIEIPISILVLDFTAYAWHVANHRSRRLWAFHEVHHSDLIFETTTAVRFHFGEIIISLGIRCLIIGVFGLSVISLVFFEIVYQLFNFFIHGNTRLPDSLDKALSRFFISPSVHRKHHSERLFELNSNYGTIFVFWDKIFSTFNPSSSVEEVKVGLPDSHRDRDIIELIKMPLVRLGD